MNKQITFLFVLIFSLTLVSAVSIYAGETIEIELDKPYEYYSVVGNSTEVNLDISQEGNIVTIIPDKYSQNDSYEVIFFDKETEIIYQSGGGGSSRTRTIYKDRDITTYRDIEFEKEVEVIKEVEVENDINKVLFWSWIILAVLFIALVISIFIKGKRGYENNE